MYYIYCTWANIGTLTSITHTYTNSNTNKLRNSRDLLFITLRRQMPLAAVCWLAGLAWPSSTLTLYLGPDWSHGLRSLSISCARESRQLTRGRLLHLSDANAEEEALEARDFSAIVWSRKLGAFCRMLIRRIFCSFRNLLHSIVINIWVALQSITISNEFLKIHNRIIFFFKKFLYIY